MDCGMREALELSMQAHRSAFVLAFGLQLPPLVDGVTKARGSICGFRPRREV